MDPLQTGDLILFACKTSRWTLFDAVIRYVTGSDYVHVGMVLIDPPFRNVPRGAYLWESGWEPTPDPQDGRLKLGVRITPLSKIDVSASHLYVRKCERSISTSELVAIHTEVYLKPYDTCLSDWLLAALRRDAHPQKTDRFWCSAFVSFVMTRLGWLLSTTDWSIVRPCDLSSRSSYLSWNESAYGADTYLSHSDWRRLVDHSRLDEAPVVI
jgi:hypothetical protein